MAREWIVIADNSTAQIRVARNVARRKHPQRSAPGSEPQTANPEASREPDSHDDRPGPAGERTQADR